MEKRTAERTLDEGFLTARDGVRLYRRSLTPRAEALAHVLIVHGYGEHCGRYRETMERLVDAGCAVHAFDLRGHGQSAGVRAHVERFAHYLDDLDLAFADAQRRAEGRPLVVLGHSLGGLILARWLLGRREGLAGAVLVSPFLGLAFEPPALKVAAARLLEVVAPTLHMDNGLRYEQLTHDEGILAATRADPLYQRQTTPRWFREAMAAQREVLRRAAELTLPCLVLLGDSDPIAAPGTGRRFYGAVGAADKTIRIYDGFLHEVLNESGRDRVWADLLDWLGRHR